MSFYQAGSTVLELAFYFSTPASELVEQTVSAPYAPFDSGTWKFSYNKDTATVTLECSNVTKVVKIASASLVTSSVSFVSGWDLTSGNVVGQSDFPPGQSWSISCQVHDYTSSYQRVARLQLMLPEALPLPSVATAREFGLVARRNISRFGAQSPNDVVFYFPRSKRELWANSQALAQASTYFATLLEEGFKEGETTDSADETPSIGNDLEEVDLSHDSEDEADSVAFKLAATRTKSCPTGVKEVIITDHAYTTYHALLSWLHYNYLDFAPLSIPPFLPKPEGGDLDARQAHIEGVAKAKPNLPLPASPKSIYELAQLVELPKLAAVALANFKSQLTVGNVLYELTTDIAFHDEACKVLEDFAVDNWKAVRETPTALALEKSGVLSALPDPTEAGARLFKLARRC